MSATSLAAWLKKLRPRKAAPEPQPPAVPVPVGIGGSKPIEYVVDNEIKTVFLYAEVGSEVTGDAYQEFFDHLKKKGYYLQVNLFKK